MKKKKIAFILCFVLLLSVGLVSYAGSKNFCRHDYSTTSNHYFSVVNHTSSEYTVKNGRKDWWPVIYYDDYVEIQFSCGLCGKRIPELDVVRLVGKHWEFAY